MSDPKSLKVFHNFFIHNTIADFYKETLDWFSNSLFERFNYKLISTYDKAIAFFRDKENLERTPGKQPLPSITLDPTGDFEPSDRGGKQLWRFPQLGSKLAEDLYIPVYEDDNIKMVVTFGRFRGTFDITMWMSSIYEYLDLKILLFQMFGGLERVIYPLFFNSLIVIPEDLYNYEFVNDITGETYKIDWYQAELEERIIRTTNKNEYVIPCNIGPQYWLTSIGDASEKYGGSDSYGQWNLTASLTYEIELPVSLTVMCNFKAKKVNFHIKSGVVYSEHDFTKVESKKVLGYTLQDLLDLDKIPPDDVEATENPSQSSYRAMLELRRATLQVQQTPEEIILSDSTACGEMVTAQFYHREFHIITQDEADQLADGTSSIQIQLQERVYPDDVLIVNCSLGNLDYYTDWTISSDGKTITFFKPLEEGDVVEFLYYRKE